MSRGNFMANLGLFFSWLVLALAHRTSFGSGGMADP